MNATPSPTTNAKSVPEWADELEALFKEIDGYQPLSIAHEATAEQIAHLVLCNRDSILSAIRGNALGISEYLPFDVKMAGAEAITEDHMAKRANYDAACDCWDAMAHALAGEQK